jgi:hypothetical protein
MQSLIDKNKKEPCGSSGVVEKRRRREEGIAIIEGRRRGLHAWPGWSLGVSVVAASTVGRRGWWAL